MAHVATSGGADTGAGNHSGRLLKMGGQRGVGRAWHERYVVIHDGVLEYFVSQADASQHGVAAKSKAPFPLDGALITSPARRSSLALGKHAALSFELKPAAGSPSTLKPLVFSASSTRVLQAWLVALQAAAEPAVPSAGESYAKGGDGRAAEVDSRLPRTRHEQAETAINEEWALLVDELARLSNAGEEAVSAEYAAVARLLDGLRPHVPAHRQAAEEEAASVSARPPMMSKQSSLVSGHI